MTKKEKEIYPRSRKEMLRIIKTAEKEGHLLETALEEFTIHPFSMPALWDCREYILGIGQENYLKKPLIISLLALLSTMAGRLDEVEEWLEKVAPDENKGIYMMDMYAYLIKIRCYLQTGKYMLAHVFVKQLIILLTPGKRHMDMCECYMLSAMIFHKANEVGMRFSDYLKSPAEYFEELTATEKAVLRLMAQGMSNDEIANKMGKKMGTMKFHSNNIFHKLQVQNRQQAVNRGREINLL